MAGYFITTSETVTGSDGDDRFDVVSDYLGGSKASIDGAGGNDVIDATRTYAGNTLGGGDGTDTLLGGYGGDSLTGGDGDDSIAGGYNGDTLIGGAGDDTLDGLYRDDLVYGGDGNDTIVLHSGADTAWGGAGDDVFDLGSAPEGATIRGGDGQDTLKLYAYGGRDMRLLDFESIEVLDRPGGALLTSDQLNGLESVTNSANPSGGVLLFTDGGRVDFGRLLAPGLSVEAATRDPSASVSFLGSAKNDALWGSDAGDLLVGRAGRDVLTPGYGNDTVYGGDDVDWIGDIGGDDFVDCGAGNDRIELSKGNDTCIGGAGDDHIDGYNGTFLLMGGAGNDQISTTHSMGAATLDGCAGDDMIQGGGGDELIYGGGGNDTIRIYAGADTAWGGDGDDVFDLSHMWSWPSSGLTIRGGAGQDAFNISDMSSFLQSVDFRGVEVLNVYGPTTVLATTAQLRSLQAITCTGNPHGQAILKTGEGRVDFGRLLAPGLTVDVSAADSAGPVHYIGGKANDVLVGSNYGDTLMGAAGDDTIEGQAGDDLIHGGSGNDYVYLQSGADTAYGGDGDDMFDLGTALAWSGDDPLDRLTIGGGAGRDTIKLASSSNLFQTVDFKGIEVLDLAADTTVWATSAQLRSLQSITCATDPDGRVILRTTEGRVDFGRLLAPGLTVDVSAAAAAGSVHYIGWRGNDTLVGGVAGDTLTAGAGDDFLSGWGGNDTLYAGDGDDLVDEASVGTDGNDLIWGGNGDDTLKGGVGDDTLAGGAGSDTLSGGAGNDRLEAGATDYADELFGHAGNDTLVGTYGLLDGGDGHDRMILRPDRSGYSSATLHGGAGDDTFVVESVLAPVIHGGNGHDTLRLEKMRGVDFADADIRNIETLSVDIGHWLEIEIEHLNQFTHLTGHKRPGVTYHEPNNLLQIFLYEEGGQIDFGQMLTHGLGVVVSTYTDQAVDLKGGDDGDSLMGSDSHDTLTGAAGDDTLYGAGGNDTVQGGSGNDHIDEVGGYGGTGDDLMTGNSGDDTLISGIGTDTVIGGTGNDFIDGGPDNDLLQGWAGDDTLDGDGGNDTLNGGRGNDTLEGGAGGDVLQFFAPLDSATNVDLIRDFSSADDTIQLAGRVFAALGRGALSTDAFTTDPAAAGGPRVVYDASTGLVSYDADGYGGSAPIAFARLTPGTALAAADFEVI